MDFLKFMENRASCREYTEKRVEQEKIDYILDCARLVPSACNSQPARYIVLTEPELIKEFLPAIQNNGATNHFLNNVKTFIVVYEERVRLKESIEKRLGNSNYFAQMDIGMAVATIAYAASSIGVDSCIIGWSENEKIKEILNLPEDSAYRLTIALGYGTGNLPPKKRKLKEELVRYI